MVVRTVLSEKVKQSCIESPKQIERGCIMKRFLVFIFPRWEQKGGWSDLFADYEFLTNANQCLKEQLDHEYGIEMDGHVVDLHTGKIV